MYPEYIRVNDKEYKINTSYKVGLKCFEIIEDPDLCEEERTLAILFLLFGFIPDEDIDLFLDKAQKYLQCGKTIEEQTENKKDMDFIQDESYIIASFMSDYKLDLSKEDIHFWQYINLIQGLTKDAILSNIREIRNYDLSEIKDAKEKQKLIKAKESVALKIRKTKEEIEKDELFEKMLKGEK